MLAQAILLGKYSTNLCSYKDNSIKYFANIDDFYSIFIVLIYISNNVKQEGTIKLKFKEMRIFDSISSIYFFEKALSVTWLNFYKTGGYISSYFEAINKAVIPIN